MMKRNTNQKPSSVLIVRAGRVPVDMPGGWNVSHFTECDECTAGEITIEDEESEEWYLKKCKQFGLQPEI